MTTIDTSRFLRPADIGTTRRNHRRIQATRILMLLANVLFIAALILGGTWIVQQIHRDERFAVTTIEINGAVHSDAKDLRQVADQWNGANLFDLEIESLRAELTSLPWIAGVAIEKKIPDTLVIRVQERVPVALTTSDQGLRYVDAEGRAFAPITVQMGNPDLPLVAGKSAEDRRRSVQFLIALRKDHPDLYARVSEVDALSPTGFRIYDRELATKLMIPEDGAPERWRRVHALAKIETWGSNGGVEYADLRFARRIVVLPRRMERQVTGNPIGIAPAAILAN